MEELKLIRPGEVRVRIAPSPTGPIHIGSARTALFNYIFAKKYKGVFILRIEDTDRQRSKKQWENDIINGLKWLGIEWQEGPYYQSKRKQIYQKYIEKLINEKKAYYCFCSPEELEEHRNYLLSIGQAPRYSEKCQQLTEKEIKENLNKKKHFVIRFKTPSKKVSFKDMLRGEIKYDSQNFGDIVIAKDIKTPLYNLACVIDDYEMKISHVIRGEDHIPNTPKQILLAKALNIKPPKFLHLPLILSKERAKLSKRQEPQSVLEYRKQGYLPEAMINFLAFLGWNPGTEREIYSLASLIKEFSAQAIQKSGAVFNIQKLDWLNAFYIRQSSKKRYTDLCLPYLLEAGLIKAINSSKFKIQETEEKISLIQLQNILCLYQERLKKFSEIPELTDFFFKKQLYYSKNLLQWKNMDNKEIKNSLDKAKKALDKLKEKDWNKQNIETSLFKMIEHDKIGDRGEILWPLRVALTGKQASASPFEIAELLGKKKVIERLKQGIKKL